MRHPPDRSPLASSPRRLARQRRHVRPARSTLHRHHPLPVGRCGAEGQQRASRACRWAPRRWPTRCGHARSNAIRPTRDWADRDRFVLSAGHGSMLLYSLLHLTGYDLSLDDIKQLPPVGQQDARPSRTRPHARCRSHHRPPRPGFRQRGRHGDRRSATGCPLQPPRPRDHRPPTPTRSSATAT